MDCQFRIEPRKIKVLPTGVSAFAKATSRQVGVREYRGVGVTAKQFLAENSGTIITVFHHPRRRPTGLSPSPGVHRPLLGLLRHHRTEPDRRGHRLDDARRPRRCRGGPRSPIGPSPASPRLNDRGACHALVRPGVGDQRHSPWGVGDSRFLRNVVILAVVRVAMRHWLLDLFLLIFIGKRYIE